MNISPYQFGDEAKEFMVEIETVCKKYNFPQFAIFYAAAEDGNTLQWLASWNAARDPLIEQLEATLDYLRGEQG